jgi:hypothetical protein
LLALDLDRPSLNGATHATSLSELASCFLDETKRQMRGELVNYHHDFPAAVSRFSPENDPAAFPEWNLWPLGRTRILLRSNLRKISQRRAKVL